MFTKILIVEDSQQISRRLREMFSDYNGFKVVGVTGKAVEARRLIAEHQPQIVTLDLVLEDGNGLELLREVKKTAASEANTNTPKIVVLTNYSGGAFREKCRQNGADGFLDKATEFEKVTTVIMELSKTG